MKSFVTRNLMALVLILLAGQNFLRAEDRYSAGDGNVRVAIVRPTEQPASGMVLLDDLIAEALRDNRDIRAAQKKYEAALDHRSVASSLPDPRLSFVSNSAFNPIPATTLGQDDMSQIGFEVMQDLPAPGKLQLQGKMAQKEADVNRHGYREMELQVVSEVKQAFYRWHYVRQAMDVIARDRDLLQKFEKISEARYSVGKGMQQDVLRAQVELTVLEKKRVELEREDASLIAKLNSLLNRPPDSLLGQPGDFPKAALPASLDELYRLAKVNSPALGQSQTQIEKNTYALELARKDYYPDFSVGAGWASRGSFGPMYMARVDVRLPAYFWRKQRYGVRESVELLGESQRQYEAAAQNLNFRVKDDYLMAKASQQLLDLYSKAMIPQATLALDASMASYQVGNLDFLSLLTNFQNVLEYEMNYYEEFANFHQALARLEESTGRRLTD